MTPGNDFGSVPPRHSGSRDTPEPGDVAYEYRTVRIGNHWSRGKQDQKINTLAAEGWELAQRSPRGGLLGGGSDTATFRRRVEPGSQRPVTGYGRLRAWWGKQGTVARWIWGGAAAVLLISAVASSFNPDSTADEPTDRSRDQGVSHGLARQMCEREMEGRLRSPSTADFGRPSITETGSEIEEYRLEVLGFVDTQNGFGATVRVDYECIVRGRGENLRIMDFTADQR